MQSFEHYLAVACLVGLPLMVVWFAVEGAKEL
jgi:hypothetical protein